MTRHRYLSDQWFDASRDALADLPLSIESTAPISFSYEIGELPDDHPRAGTTVRFRLRLDPEHARASLEETDEPGDVRFAMTYEVARSVAAGDRGGSRAFLDGDIRLGGDVALLIERADDLVALNTRIGGSDA